MVLCNYCGEKVAGPYLTQHLKKFHPINVICDYCGEKVPSESITDHVKNFHYCKDCDKSGISCMKSHILKFHMSQCYKCKKQVDDIDQHIQNEHTTKKCSWCEEEIPFGQFIEHVLDCHEAFVCSQCNQAYSQEDYLNHECRIAQKACPLCYEIMGPNFNLRKHLKDEHSDVPCKICKKSVPTQNMDAHLKNLHSNWVRCRKCGYDVNNYEELVEHLKKRHSKFQQNETKEEENEEGWTVVK